MALQFGGGGAYISGPGSADFTDCNLFGNEAPGGGGSFILGSANFTNCKLYDNEAKPVSVWPGAGAACACGREACCHCRFGSTGTRYVMLGLGQGHITAAAVDDGDGWDDGGDDG